MPSNKTITIMILCLAVVASTWLLSRKPASYNENMAKNGQAVSVRAYTDTSSSTSADWKNILTTVSPKDNGYSDLTKTTPSTPEDTTLTAQMAKDLFSNYLLTTKTSQEFSSDVALQVADNVLTTPDYTQSAGAVYVENNLHVVGNDSASRQAYKDTLNASIRSKFNTINTSRDPAEILSLALQADNEQVLAALDPLIKINQSFIGEMLAMKVPKSAVTVHLGLLNAASDILSDLIGMRQTFVDPVKTIAAMGQYHNHMNALTLALKDVNAYFEEN